MWRCGCLTQWNCTAAAFIAAPERPEKVLRVSAAGASGAFHRHPPSLWRMPLALTLTADTVLYTECKFDVHEWNCIESPRLTLRCGRIVQISPLKSHLISFILPAPNSKPFLSILKLSFISFLSCDDTRKLMSPAAFKKPSEGDREEIQEATANLSAAKEIRLCCRSGSFIKNWWHFHIKRRTKSIFLVDNMFAGM